MAPSIISLQQLADAHVKFREVEPRDLFYRAVRELIDLSLHKKTKVTVPEAGAVLLQTWNKANKALYRFQPFDEQHFSKIEKVVNSNLPALRQFEKRSIADFEEVGKPIVKEIFRDFELVLGLVGAAKSMRLLALRFFSALGSGDS